MSRVWDRRHFEYGEVDIKAADQAKWKHLYEFDVPVVHVERTGVIGETSARARKLKHRFTEADLEALMDEVEKKS